MEWDRTESSGFIFQIVPSKNFDQFFLMLFDWFSKKSPSVSHPQIESSSRESARHPSVNYGWIITGQLVIGSMPKTQEDWLLLENMGINKRFSCCYPKEHIFSPIPSNWTSLEVSMPDHRMQESLTPEKLESALNKALVFIDNGRNGPTYLHCFAGQERSCLLAIGIVCLSTNKNVFEGLDWVRQCYKRAKPLYDHLEVLETVLSSHS